jgi:hypothetical protein
MMGLTLDHIHSCSFQLLSFRHRLDGPGIFCVQTESSFYLEPGLQPAIEIKVVLALLHCNA